MFVNFFIKRPIFAIVCSLIIMLLGAISIPTLPIAQYPDIVPPQVTVTATYTGASAEVVESAVTTPLEQEINGVEGMKYISSISSNDGTSTITVTFNLERDINLAAVDVQNRITAAQGRLPDEVKVTGVKITKSSPQIIMALALYSDEGKYDNLFISNYADLYIKDALRRVKGVGQVTLYGERKYAMRLWLDPNRLATRELTASDVVKAVEEQNVEVPAGQIGQPPTSGRQAFQMSVRALGRLANPSEFNEMVLKTGDDGSLVKLKDVGRVELGAEDYTVFMRFNGHKGVGIGVYLLPGANALQVYDGLRTELKHLATQFPPGMKYSITLDTARVVDESIHEVVKTLFEAIVIVVIVMFIFLQDWRSTLIPFITIPVSLVGTFMFTKLLGFSINTLTLFSLVLATGLVVDDAIIVVENIARVIDDQGISPRQAAPVAMTEMAGAIIAISLVLVAVFLPVSLFPGTTGQFYKQFALTIACSMAISTFNALTLTPALAAILLHPEEEHRGWFFGTINRFLEALRIGYQWALVRALRFKSIVVVLFILSLGFTYWLFTSVPIGFVPSEDQSYFVVNIQAPEGTSLDYTDQIVQQVEQKLHKIPEINGIFADPGFGFTGNGSNKAVIYTTLKPLAERTKPNQSVDAVINQLSGSLSQITGATVIPFNAPAIQGIGNVGGFQFELEDQRSGSGFDTLEQTKNTLVSRGNNLPQLQGLFSPFTANSPQLIVKIDRDRAKALQVPLNGIFDTLQVFMGSRYVNDFDFLNRIYRVYVQADYPFRSNPKDIRRFYVRSQTGEMVPLSNLVQVTPTTAPQTITHYNLFRSAEITGSPKVGTSSGQAIAAMQNLAKEVLPRGISYEWSGISLEQLESGSQTVFIFILGFVFVFLVMAAQYENLIDPLIILLSVPLAILGALLAQSVRGLENDVFCQIGMVMLIGLACKNAILIVEFANQLREHQGLTLAKAAIQAAQLRLRPILMTSLAFILGVLPLVNASGGGALGRRSLGTAVFGGMLVSTILSLFVVPVLYVVIGRVRDWVKAHWGLRDRSQKHRSLPPSKRLF